MTLKQIEPLIEVPRFRFIIQLEGCSYNSEYSFNVLDEIENSMFDEFVSDHKNYIVEYISINVNYYSELVIYLSFPTVYDDI